MSMDRRNFLARLLAGATGAVMAATVDLEKLLWVPGEKTIVLPPSTVFLGTDGVYQNFGGGNHLLTVEWITREALHILEQNLVMASEVPRIIEDCKIGYTVTMRRPVRFLADNGGDVIASIPAVDPVNRKVKQVILTDQLSVQVDVDGINRCRSREEARELFVEPMALSLAHRAKERGLNVFAPMSLPHGVDEAVVVRTKGGGVLRGIKAYSVVTNQTLMRLDLLGGRLEPKGMVAL